MFDDDIHRPLDSRESVRNALCTRVYHARLDLITKHGLDKVLEAIEQKASRFEGVKLEEIGTSDVSCWLMDIEKALDNASIK